MILHILLLILGFIMIAKGGDLFVDSSVNIARLLQIPRIIIGGTIVSLATTVPEISVSVMASLIGDSGIAIGNAIGSAIANIGLIVGIVACISVIEVQPKIFIPRALWMSASAVLVSILAANLSISRVGGFLLLVIALAYLAIDYWNVRMKKEGYREVSPPGHEDSGPRLLRSSVIAFLAGIVLVIFASRILIFSGRSIAIALGIPSSIIGLSVIAVGTSLPELVTGITSAIKRVPDLSLGNIVGANVLNLALLIGFCASIKPIDLLPFTYYYSFPWLIVFISALFLMLGKKGFVTRRNGIFLLILYFLYIAGLIIYPAISHA